MHTHDLTTVVKAHLQKHCAEFDAHEFNDELVFGIVVGTELGSATFPLLLCVQEKERRLTFRAYCNSCQDDNQAEMLMLLNELNCDIKFGRWGLNRDTGVVHFVNGLWVGHSELTDEQVGYGIAVCHVTMEWDRMPIESVARGVKAETALAMRTSQVQALARTDTELSEEGTVVVASESGTVH